MIRSTLLAIAAAGAFAAPAFAAPEMVTSSVSVSYADINMNSVEGAKSLNRRIHVAADTACGGRPGNDLREIGDYSRCVREAVANAVDRVRSPQLSALNGRDMPLLLASR